ncbi:hypothetical protein KFU94_37120 [Chloroflexi bacterium TSY]|nr:hypothetical protein [Chloroflexi bacterium TSY]
MTETSWATNTSQTHPHIARQSRWHKVRKNGVWYLIFAQREGNSIR